MPYYQLYYHLVWATKYRNPVLIGEVESLGHGFLHDKARSLGARVFALNGVADHVHMVVSIPPKLSVAKFVGQVKAVASVRFNRLQRADLSFYWQTEYAAFTFDGKRLPNYVAYVERQKEHHAEQTVIPILERTEGEGGPILREAAVDYLVEDVDWRREMEALTLDDALA